MRLYDELKLKNLKLLGKIQNLHSSIQVCCRVRPPSETESNAGGKLCVDASDETNVYIYDAATAEWVLFELDAVWGYDHTQVDVFADVEPLVGIVAEGKNACVMAYGDTQAGQFTKYISVLIFMHIAGSGRVTYSTFLKASVKTYHVCVFYY